MLTRALGARPATCGSTFTAARQEHVPPFELPGALTTIHELEHHSAGDPFGNERHATCSEAAVTSLGERHAVGSSTIRTLEERHANSNSSAKCLL